MHGTRRRPERDIGILSPSLAARSLAWLAWALVVLTIVPGGGTARAQATPPPATPAVAPASSLGWEDDFETEDGTLNVATTVAPISSIVRNVGGTLVDVHGVVPDGTNSHTFEPAPSDAALLSRADLVIVNGLALEEPTIALAEANLREGAAIYRLGEGTISPGEWAFDFSFPADEGDPNPHLWTSVPFALRYAELVAGWLSGRDPANVAAYAANLDAFRLRLQALDAGIRAAIGTVPEANRKLLTYHDSWAYFAREYGMAVVGAVQPSDFSEPSAREVADLIEQIRTESVPAVFGSEVFPSPVLEQIAAEAGATYVDGLRDDAPPGEPFSPDHTYVGMMLTNMALMVPALGGDAAALATVPAWDTYVV
ncbi:MAG: metal ABC transporter substrate-binding protein [Chloroflexota bacterium]|nr:metal ABC transporter substrate-binding protein [Chloroflexota bacterium]